MIAGLGGEHGLVPDPANALPGWKQVARERMLGYLDVLGPAGVEPVVHRQVDNSDEEARSAATALLTLPDRPTGVLCYSDVLAHGVVRAAEDLGLSVPGDLSVIGFDDSPLAARLRPALTTVRQDIAAKGTAAAAALTAAMRAVRDGTAVPVEHILLSTELVVRESTARA